MTGTEISPDEGIMPAECAGIPQEELTELHSEEITPKNVWPLVSKQNMVLFQKVAAAYAAAERRMKHVEWLDGTDVPSINELRYVSYHLFKACQHQNAPQKQHEELKRAERHCKRASFDAMELGIIAQLEKITDFKNDFKDVVITDILNDFPDLMAQAEKAKNFLKNAAGIEDRDDYYEASEPHLQQLTHITEKLDANRDELVKQRNRLGKAEQKANLAVGAAIVSAVVAVVALAWPKVFSSELGGAAQAQTKPQEQVQQTVQAGTANATNGHPQAKDTKAK